MKNFIHIRILLLVAIIFIAFDGFTQVVYEPSEPMWDTWVFKDGSEYHLFFLSKGNIGRAVSRDLIHWEHLPPIKNMAKKGDWDEKGMLMTGSTVKHGNKYYLSYGCNIEGTPIGLLVSDDLMTWKRMGDPLLKAQAPYMDERAQVAAAPLVRRGWRDLSAIWDDKRKQWDGYLYATHAKTSRPSIAHVSSKDFINWDYHEPIFIGEKYKRGNNGFFDLEVPDVFEMGGKHYIIFSCIRSRKNFSSGRQDASGTWYLMADKKEGPYRVPKNPLLLGTGMGRYDHYVGRTVMHRGNRLLYHQNWGDQKVDFSSPKLVVQDKDHQLFLKYWPALDTLKRQKLYSREDLVIAPDTSFRYKEFKLGVEAGDFMLTCEIDIKDARSLTLFWRKGNKEQNQTPACGLMMEPGTGSFSMVKVSEQLKYNGNTYQCHLMDQYTEKSFFAKKMKLRVMVRKGRAEIYVNDHWIYNVGVEDFLPKGDLGLLVDSGKARISKLEIYELEPLVLTEFMINL